MKKRILALVLCLVTAVSMLPITAAAYTEEELSSSTNNKYCGYTHFKLNFPEVLSIQDEGENKISFDNGKCMLPSGKKYIITYSDELGNIQTIDISILNHNWQLTQTKNSLTATCRNPEELEKEDGRCKCSVGETSLTLVAHSVTLPNSPFNARLEGLEQFQEEVPNAKIGEFVYKYKGPNGWSVVEPTAANAKAGEYQVGVRIKNLPRYEESDVPDGPVAFALEENPDGAGNAVDLYVQYTAADPDITAQTGDNRPIELMMAGMAVFSLLAAAAFILDSKRKYSR